VIASFDEVCEKDPFDIYAKIWNPFIAWKTSSRKLEE
jgi:hypothetical protein